MKTKTFIKESFQQKVKNKLHRYFKESKITEYLRHGEYG